MVFKKKKVNPRRERVRQSISSERMGAMNKLANSHLPLAVCVLIFFILAVTAVLAIDTSEGKFFRPGTGFFVKYPKLLSLAAIIIFTSIAAAMYIFFYQYRILQRPARMIAIAGLFLILLMTTKLGSLFPDWSYLATGTAVTSAIILTIAYNQRFALGMSLFYSLLACFAVGQVNMELFVTMTTGVVGCCYLLKEIRTRMKLIEVTLTVSVAVLIIASAMGVIQGNDSMLILSTAGSAALVTLAVGIIIQGFLPMIEKTFGIATSMTLIDYSDANQPLLKKLAMEAPGTFSHSLLIGTIAEAAAEAINANGLLCRVGAYYHDIGKIHKSPYFIENQMGSSSRHDLLSPAMSQLVIVGHVKDGIETAKEYGLPAVLRQFIETHHGTTLIEYFYNEARKKQNGKVSESEFRYPGPKPATKEAAIVMLADTCESAVRALSEATPTRIESVVHNMAMKRLQDGQFDECDLTLRELSKIEDSLAKSLTAHHHGRIKYPQAPLPKSPKTRNVQTENKAQIPG
jgi:hypothetical protein